MWEGQLHFLAGQHWCEVHWPCVGSRAVSRSVARQGRGCGKDTMAGSRLRPLSLLSFLVAPLLWFGCGVAANPEGAPNCGAPDRNPHGSASSGDGGFGLTFTSLTGDELDTLPEGSAVSVSLGGSSSFKGFLMSVGGGSYGSAPSGTKKLANCESDALTHSNKASRSSMAVTFTPPEAGGTVTFKYYVVKSEKTWYGPLYTSIHCDWGNRTEITPAPVGSTDNGSGAGDLEAGALALSFASIAAIHAVA